MGTQISGLTTPHVGGTSSTAATGSSTLGKDSFLRLLTAQLANQDPTAPSDDQAFVAQLAQFSQVEQAEGMNSRLDSLLLAQSSNNQTATAAFIGKDVIFNSNQVGITDKGGTIMGNLAATASTVTVTITDSAGKTVKTMNLKDVNGGALKVPWDGRSDSGVQLPAGQYTVAFDAKDASGNPVTVKTQGQARVTGVSFAKGYPELIVNNTTIKMSDVISVLEATGATSAASQALATSTPLTSTSTATP
jgi:flagellar basal-body rod modification protein FlgD